MAFQTDRAHSWPVVQKQFPFRPRWSSSQRLQTSESRCRQQNSTGSGYDADFCVQNENSKTIGATRSVIARIHVQLLIDLQICFCTGISVNSNATTSSSVSSNGGVSNNNSGSNSQSTSQTSVYGSTAVNNRLDHRNSSNSSQSSINITNIDKYNVCRENIAYLAALLPVSSEVQARLKLTYRNLRTSQSNSSETTWGFDGRVSPANSSGFFGAGIENNRDALTTDGVPNSSNLLTVRLPNERSSFTQM